MRKGLYIAYNSYLFIEFLAIKKDFPDVEWDCMISRDYNQTEEQYHSFELIIKNAIDKKKLFSKIIDEPERRYDIILCPSYFENNLGFLLRKQDPKELVYYEAGINDYISSSICKRNPDLFMDKVKYMKNPMAYRNDFFKTIKRLDVSTRHIQEFLDLLPYNKSDIFIPNIDLVLFTYPMDVMFGYLDYEKDLVNYLETNYPQKRILIKPHPRDVHEYQSDQCAFFNINQTFPGQLIVPLYPCEHLYVYPTSVLLSEYKPYKLIKYNSDKILVNKNQYEKLFKKDILKKNDLVSYIDF